VSSVHAARFAGLPAPKKDKLTLYVFGPGFGESQVVALPDGRWMVVDSCIQGGVNLPLELLRHFEAPSIYLLAVTHPDLDHLKGIPELIESFEIRRLWRYPGFQQARDIILHIERDEPHNTDFRELRRVSEAIRPFMATPRGEEVRYGTRLLPESKDYRVACVAPCGPDVVHENDRLGDLFGRLQRGAKLSHADRTYMMGQGNNLSLAIVIWWNDLGILLGGDVEHDDKIPNRGWPGILA